MTLNFRQAPAQRAHRAVDRGQHRQAGPRGHPVARAGHAELRQRNDLRTLLAQLLAGLGHQRVVACAVAGVERGQRLRDQGRVQLGAGGELGRHGLQRGREAGDQPDRAAQRHGVDHHGLVGFQHGQRRMLARDGLDARAEGRAGEQDALAAAVDGVLRQARKTCVHRGVQPPAGGRQVGREAVVQQVHAHRFGPVARQGGVDGRDRMGQRVDQGNAGHAAAATGMCRRGRMRRPWFHQTSATSSSAGR